MALTNGTTDSPGRSQSPAQNLGKRKRTSSSELVAKSEDITTTPTGILKDALQLIKSHDPSAAVSRFPFPFPLREDENHTVKKQKIGALGLEYDSIESRFSRGAYDSLNEVMEDVSKVKNAAIMGDPATNGHSYSIIKEAVSAIWDSLSLLQSQVTDTQPQSPEATNGYVFGKHKTPVLPSSQVLSLRSQTEHGVRQLFSGLPKATELNDVDGRRLPNGFELTEILTIDKNDLQGKDTRNFGDVFASHGNAKTLEMPRTSRSLRGNALSFIPPFENIPSTNRNDYKFTSLNTGSWLKYAICDKVKPESKAKSDNNTRTNTLFKAAFSTFAPTTDNSQSVITDFDRSQQWWKQRGRPVAEDLVKSPTNIPGSILHTDDLNNPSDKDLEEMVNNFIPEDDQISEGDKVLDEVSDLIETLNSYQSMRDLVVAKGPSSASKPSKEEQTTYEVLRSQLQLLVSCLPPFAVAKLNGDMLEQLNISTKILVSPPEFVGTAQVDEYTLRRNRATQAATSAAGRNSVSVTNRNAYSTPASAYNAQARAYNNMPNSAYSARPSNVPMYNTPRPPTTSQTSTFTQPQYRANGPVIHAPSVQQFQRPIVNGYGPTAAPTPPSSYVQRPSQPGYQQRAQDSAAFHRTDQAHKPLVNGDMSHYPQRQYVVSNNNYSASPPSTTGPQNPTNDAPRQHQSSGAPQPQIRAADTVSAVAS